MNPEVATDPGAFAATARTAPAGARVPVELRTRVDDPFLAYRRARDGAGGSYLETTGGQSGWGYFGVDPIELISVDPRESAAADTNESETLATLASELDEERLVRGDCTVPYPCGLIGWLSYDIARELESLPDSAARDRDLPRLQVGKYDRIASWEEPREGETTLRITACPVVSDPDDEAAIEEAYDRGRQRAVRLARRVHAGELVTEDPPVQRDTATFESDCGRAAFTDRVQTIKAAIRAGDTFQANISHRLRAPAAVTPVEAFAALRTVNPAPYSALLEFPGVDLVSASPELLLERDGDHLVTEPIAGTRPRGTTPEADAALESDLRTDEKERAEHAMLVDLERNDLGKVSHFGTVDVTEYRRVDRYAEVMHLVSAVEGRLRDGADLADAIAAVFPGGTITGAPKPKTMALIDEVETTRRGPYTGSVGIFGFDDRATLSIIIRTLARHGPEYHLRVGAGIVHDSEPDSEYDETLDKARALVTAVDEALGNRADLGVQER